MMTRRAHGAAPTGQITEVNNSDNDSPFLCKACDHIIFTKGNLGENDKCPYCHNNAYTTAFADRLLPDWEDDGPVIAEAC